MDTTVIDELIARGYTAADFEPADDGCGPDCDGDHSIDYCCNCGHFSCAGPVRNWIGDNPPCRTSTPCGDFRCCN